MRMTLPEESRIPEGFSPSSMKIPRGGPRRRGAFLEFFFDGGETEGDISLSDSTLLDGL